MHAPPSPHASSYKPSPRSPELPAETLMVPATPADGWADPKQSLRMRVQNLMQQVDGCDRELLERQEEHAELARSVDYWRDLATRPPDVLDPPPPGSPVAAGATHLFEDAHRA